jgi:hypothetical protein
MPDQPAASSAFPLTGKNRMRTLVSAMHGHAHSLDDVGQHAGPRPAPSRLADNRVLALQRAAGNRAVVGLLQTGTPLTLQRCGGETHHGCSCADEGATQTTEPAGHDHT